MKRFFYLSLLGIISIFLIYYWYSSFNSSGESLYMVNNNPFNLVTISKEGDKLKITSSDWEEIAYKTYENEDFKGFWKSDKGKGWHFGKFISDNEISVKTRSVNGTDMGFSTWTKLNKFSTFLINIKKEVINSFSKTNETPISDNEERYIDLQMTNLESFFIMNKAMKKLSDDLYRKAEGNSDLYAYYVYDWMNNHIEYQHTKGRYAAPMHVFNFRKGICGETTALYGAFMKHKSINWSYADIEIDYKDKKVHHACSLIKIGERAILVDPVAYQMWDVKHKSYTPISDELMLEIFRKLNR